MEKAEIGIVRVDNEVLLKTGEEAWQQLKTCYDALERIQTSVEASGSFWIGQAGDLYREVLKNQIESVKAALEEMAQYPKELLAYAGLYSETMSQSNSLAESIISLQLF